MWWSRQRRNLRRHGRFDGGRRVRCLRLLANSPHGMIYLHEQDISHFEIFVFIQALTRILVTLHSFY